MQQPPLLVTSTTETTPNQPSTTSQQPHEPQPISQPPPQHWMTTRAKNKFCKPIQKLNLHTHLTPSSDLKAPTVNPSFVIEPTNMTQAFKDHNWPRAMSKEYDALVRNGTWELVPPILVYNIVGCKWIFHIKRHFDGSIDRFKARLVAKGFH